MKRKRRTHPEAGAAGRKPTRAGDRGGLSPATELLILDDGRVLVHHLSPAMTELLSGLNPTDGSMHRRAARGRECARGPALQAPRPRGTPDGAEP